MGIFKSKEKKKELLFVEKVVIKKIKDAQEYAKGKKARQLAQKTCKNDGCSNLRANGSSRCSSCKR